MRTKMFDGRLPVEAEDEGEIITVTTVTENPIPDEAELEITLASGTMGYFVEIAKDANINVEVESYEDNTINIIVPADLVVEGNNCKVFAVTEDEDETEEDEE